MNKKNLIGYRIFFLLLGLVSLWLSRSLLTIYVWPALQVAAFIIAIFCVHVLFVKPREWPLVVLSLSTILFFAVTFIVYSYMEIEWLDVNLAKIAIGYSIGTVVLSVWAIIR